MVLSNVKIEFSEEDIKNIWVKCLFNRTNDVVRLSESRQHIYNLLLEVIKHSSEHTELLNILMMSVLEPYLREWKTMTS